MFVIQGFEVEKNNVIIILKVRKSIKKSCVWIFFFLGIRFIQEINQELYLNINLDFEVKLEGMGE